MKQVAEIIRQYTEPVVVVLSAIAGTTDDLLTMLEFAVKGDLSAAQQRLIHSRDRHVTICENLELTTRKSFAAEFSSLFSDLEKLLRGISYLKEIPPRSRDAALVTGELLSTKIFAAYLGSLDVNSCWFDARRILRTDQHFGQAVPDRETIRRLSNDHLTPAFADHAIVITQGFMGACPANHTTTLGRGGSDYSAALLGEALDADAIEIWTDVNGIMSADPRIVKNARSQPELSFQEASEMAILGAKVLHPATLAPAMDQQIPVLVKNTLAPEMPGTKITAETANRGQVKAITCRRDISILTLTALQIGKAEFINRIFSILNCFNIPLDVLAISENAMSLAVKDRNNIDKVLREVSNFAGANIQHGYSIVSLVGEQANQSPAILKRIFYAIDGCPVDMVRLGAGNHAISMVLRDTPPEKAIRLLHKEFFENETPAEKWPVYKHQPKANQFSLDLG